jgi:hypothetical protein
MNDSNTDILQIDVDSPGELEVENLIKINPGKSKSLSFMRAQVKDPLDYIFGVQRILEASSCEYLEIILCSDLSWTYQTNYTVQKDWRVLHFIMRVLKGVNSYTKSLAYLSLVRLILENGAVCWDPYSEGHINALDHVQKKVAKFANRMSDLVWDTLVQRRKIAGICALFKAYTGEQAWQSIGDRLKDHAT